MHRLEASDDEFDPVEVVNTERRERTERPWVMLNMVASVDGATAIDGVSGGLGGDADSAMFGAIRSVPDVILVGAATVRAERYNPPLQPRPAAAAHRARRNQAERPRLCVLSGSLQLDADLPFLDDDPKPFVATGADAARRAPEGLLDRVELLETGPALDLHAVLAALGRHGAAVVLCEGGPSLNAQLVAADLIDEICVTIAPLAAGGTSKRIAQGEVAAVPPTFIVDRVLTRDEHLFVRYLRDRS